MKTAPTYTETRIKKRNLPDLLVHKFLTEYGYDHGPVIARAIVDDLLATLQQCCPERVPPKTVVWLAVRCESRGQRKGLAVSDLIPVQLSMITDSEVKILTDPEDRAIGQEWQHFNPAWLHVRLTQHPEYCLQFADRMARYCFNGGLLTANANTDRWLDRADQMDMAIIAESARWGDAKQSIPLTKAHWQQEVDYMANTYFPQRTAIVIAQMRSVDMFPDQAIVTLNRHGGEVAKDV